jgi:hypothetical protein
MDVNEHERIKQFSTAPNEQHLFRGFVRRRV